MNYKEVAEKLTRLGFRCARTAGESALWVNPQTGASVGIANKGDIDLTPVEVAVVLEALGLSWAELESG